MTVVRCSTVLSTGVTCSGLCILDDEQQQFKPTGTWTTQFLISAEALTTKMCAFCILFIGQLFKSHCGLTGHREEALMHHYKPHSQSPPLVEPIKIL